jgi:glycosyltransferase involved in cell wall biosynthesis
MPDQAALLVERLRAEGWKARPVRTNLGPGPVASRVDALRGVRTLVRWPVFLARLAAVLPRVRVVHVLTHSGLGFFLFAVPSVLLARAAGRRAIVAYHGGGADEFLARRRRSVAATLRRAHAVTVPSAYLREVFSRHGIATRVVPNVCELERFHPAPAPPAVPRLLVSRHLEPIYNVPCAVRAFARIRERFPQAALTILGDGSDAPRVRETVRKLGLGDRVALPGYVPHGELPRLLRETSILLNPSNVDNAPISILEAFACAVPVVTTRVGGIPFIVEDGRTGLLVDPDDDAAMAEAALRLLERPELAREIAENASREALRHAWPAVYVTLRRIYAGEAG